MSYGYRYNEIFFRIETVDGDYCSSLTELNLLFFYGSVVCSFHSRQSFQFFILRSLSFVNCFTCVFHRSLLGLFLFKALDRKIDKTHTAPNVINKMNDHLLGFLLKTEVRCDGAFSLNRILELFPHNTIGFFPIYSR